MTSTYYRPRTWWITATLLTVAVVSAVQTSLELNWITRADLPDGLTVTLVSGAHGIALAICALFFTIVQVVRSGQSLFFGYRERYLIGVGYGLVFALVTAVAAASLASDSFLEAVETSGVLMTASLVSFVMPVACIVGGTVWHFLGRVPAGSATPTRKRRPIEDPE